MEPAWNETDIAIVGMAGRFPGADDVGELWRNLREGVSSVRELSDDELRAAGVDAALLARPNLVKVMAMPRRVDCFDATFFGFSHREAEVMDPQQRLLLECAWEALEDAGYVGETYPGPIGVFAGLSTSTYLLYQIMANPAVLATLDQLHIDLGNSGDYLTTRISHKLNLTGPSFLIQSACSTGLVAVHAACQSLLAEECDMALAGSASINVGHFRGYLYQEGGIVSPDGRCRTFDARAQGSVVGSGLGLVVLKRLADAVADGDTIRAVIKGSAINNDGALKVGYTAPSVEGQARVIAEALARSGVDAADVSYVEAHGTGTPLGDPIEVEALTRAFDTNGRRQLCALGSVKTNVGHLATAAGITGLIKTVLALENEQIPPSLHFERPNPEINFADSPFYVNVELRPWPRNGGGPRRAGVSAFGFGGTNAHVILQEAPPLPAASPSARPHQLLLLAARSPRALDAATANLATHLRDHPELELADVAYTLQRGRKAFDHRRALVCRDRGEAVALLADPASEGVYTGHAERSGAGVAFLFPGLGDQHLHMAAGLYAAEPSFRAEVDRSCELLTEFLGTDLREVLYPEQRPADEASAAPGLDLRRLLGRGTEVPDEASRRLDRTLFAHPATFVIEHALARLWMEWGVSPKAMMGYSLGEYTAACIAGVFSLEDALRLVAGRARLIEELPGGAMLVVPLSEDEVLPRLGPELSLAAVNAPQMCVVAGSESAVAELAEELARQGIAFRRLRTAHAFHSRLMEPVAQRLVESVRRLALKAPRIPYLSNVTGTWITGREATDPEYWGRHLCAPVRFSAGLDKLFQEPGRFLLEVGPGQALSTAARQHPVGGGVTAVPCLGERGGAADQAAFMRAAGRLWLAGIEVDGERFFRHERRRRIPLPTYPFERQRYWIEARPEAALAARAAAVELPAAEPGPAPPAADLSEHPRPTLRNAYVAPRDEMERVVAGIWQKLLGIDEVGVHDDFFELGGHSFLTTVLVTELRQAFGVDVGIRELFEKPTVAGFAAAIRDVQAREPAGAVPLAELPQIVPDPASRHLPFPLTDVQYAYLIGRGDAFALGQVSTHAYAEVDAVGIDLARLTDAYRLLIERHDMLRGIVHPDGRQEILASVPPFEIATLDLRGCPEEEVAAALAAVRRRMSHQVLPSDRWPLYELRASLLDRDRVRLHLSFDFLIGDAWSLQVLLPELSLAYHGRQSELKPLSVSFRDYVVATSRLEESPAYERALAYWFSRLDDFPLAPELPLAMSPEAIRRPTFVRHPGRLETAAWQRLKARAARGGLTPSGLLLAAFAEVLTVWSKSPRFVINVTLFNRLPLHPEVNGLVGDFTSLTLLAIDNSRPAPFGERAQRVQTQLFDDLDHSALSGIRVLRELTRRRGGHGPAMMPVIFTSTLTQISPREALAGLGEAELGFVISQTPQVWLDHQVLEDPLGLSYSWDVVEGLFPPGMIEDMLAAYQGLLERLVAEEDVWQAASPVLPPARQLALFAAANATALALPDGLLHAPLAAIAASAPERQAVIAGDQRLTYGELAAQVEALASRLRELGAARNTLVGVTMEKGWEQVAAVLAVLNAGAAYCPIDATWPQERRWRLFERGEIRLVLTQPGLDRELEWPPDVVRIVVDRGPGRLAGGASGGPEPEDLAYVIFTSGSTGQPKGVVIDHRGAVNTILDLNQRFGVGSGDRVLAISSLSFDLSVYDVFGMVAAGGTIVLPPAADLREPARLSEILHRERVTVWSSVPALMEMVVGYLEGSGGTLPPSLRLVLLSGDWIPVTLPDRIRALAPGAQVISLGGATEASIWSIHYPIGAVDPAWPSIPYGWPLANQSFHVLNGRLEPCPVWVPGELYIGGVGVAKGYWRDEERTGASFIVHPTSGERLYKTGDLGRYLPDGAIEFLGREDFQVKIHGFRIELGEIEAVLGRHGGIREALVLAPAEERGGRRLVAYVVPAAGGAPDAAELRAFLSDQLPAYMVPADFVVLDSFPLTANGKVDRQALPRPQDGRAPVEISYVPPSGPVEELLAGIWSEVLGLERVGAEDDFFALGGQSLLATRLVSRVRQALNVELPLRVLFDRPTIASLAAEIARSLHENDIARATAELPQIVPDPASRHLPFPLTDVQYAYLIGRGDDFALGRVSTHGYSEIDARGIDLERLTDAFRYLIARHDMLRAIVHPDGRQEILASVPPFEITRLDLRGRPEAEASAALAAVRRRMSHQVLPSDRWPLYELRASLLVGDRVRLHFSFDFLIGDAWSLQLLLSELSLVYNQRQSELRPLSLSFRDYVLATAATEEWPAYRRALAYWTARLADFPAAPDLPLATSPAVLGPPTFVRYSGRLETQDWQRLKARAAHGGLTSSSLLLAAFAEVLTVWCKSPRFAINLTLFNRLPLHPEVNDLVGDFTALTLLAIDNTRPAPFGERARLLQKQLFADLDHSLVSGVRVLREIARRQGGRAPAMMPVVFTSTLNLVVQNEALTGLGAAAEWGYAVSQTPQIWLDHQVFVDPRGLSYTWDVVEGLFPPGMIEDMLESYRGLLARLTDEEAAWEALRPVLPPERQLALFAAANATAGPVPDGLLHEPFAAQARRAPERTAVIAGEVSLTYGELAHQAYALARRLRALGAAPNTLVAVVMEKGWEQVVGVLAVLAAGAAYLPIDPELPRARRFFLFVNGGVEIALTQPDLAARLEWPQGLRRLVVSSELSPDGREEDGWPLPAVQRPHDLAYVIYTSGSTGNPKGVMIDHQGALNTVIDVNERFGVGAADRVLALSSLSFDLSVYDVFGVLAAGGTVVLPEAGQSRDPQHWAQLIERHGVTLWNTVPALMEMLADFGEVTGYRALSLRLVMLSGDWISLRLPARIRTLAEEAAVVSLGGATEASIWSILFPIGEVDAGWRSIPYGRAMKNQAFHVLDKDLLPRPVGVPGQLYIGGIGLAKGYWADPEKTASAFLVDPRTEERLYRTGDLGRYLADGTIEFLGREDCQVKVGGFRIELGEIEAVLGRHGGIREALVLAPAAERGGRRLVAYVVPAAGGAPDAAELRAFLSDQLPAYMVPADFVVLDSFPLTANGKVDRQALPRPQDDRAPVEISYVPPSGPVEELLAGYFREVLNLDQVGATDDFFELGGNSLLATQVISRVRHAFRVELPLRAIFEAPALAQLAARIGWEIRGPQAPATGQVSREAPLELSFAQQRLWFLDQLAPGSPVYNIPLAVELTGPLEVAVLAAALAEVVRRHEALRTTFQVVDGEPAQRVAERLQLLLPVIDLRSLAAGERDPETRRLASAEARQPFDLGRGPLLRATLLCLGAARHTVLLTMHHIISDGWSMGVLVREIGALYAAFLAGQPSPLPELLMQYADFAAWQRRHLSSELPGSELAWWRGHLAGMPPALELPADHPRPAAASGRGADLAFALDREALDGLAALSRGHRATLFMTLLAGFAGLLQRLTGENDLVIGTPAAGRTRVELELLIGFFVNTLMLRLDLSGDPGFAGVLDRARETTLTVYAHQEVPFERLVKELAPERDLSRPPLVQVLFVLQNAPLRPLELPGLALAASPVSTRTAKLDLTCTLIETERGLEGTLEYSRDLFEAPTMARLAGLFTRLLAAAVAEPQQRLSELPLLSAAERHQLTVDWSGAPPRHPCDATIHGLFAEQAARTPGAVAVVCGDEELTYADVAIRSRRLGRRLLTLNLPPESRIAIVAERSPALIVGLLGILQAGGAYLPLDPELPSERLAFLLADAGATVILAEREALDSLPADLRREGVPLEGVRVLALDDEEEGGETPLLPEVAATDLAYVLYTSGSTGTPKGVAVPHRGVVRLVVGADWADLGPGETFLQLVHLTFDVSVFEIWAPLLNGGRLVLYPGRRPALDQLAEVIARHGVTTMWLTSGLFHQMVDERLDGLRPLRQLVAGGDVLSPPHVRRALAGLPGCILIDGYGPTENSILTTSHAMTAADLEDERLAARVPIGRAIRGTEVYVLGADLRPVPIGVWGELVAGGDGVARCYLGRPALTAESFVCNPFAREPGARLYRTGDIVRWRADGVLEFLGRRDGQVKVRGIRIELGEIEAALARQPGVREAVVLVREDERGDKRLVAYVVAAGEPGPSPAHLREALRRSLPEPMVPAVIMALESLPLTANGKVDRRALSRIAPLAVQETASYTAPQGLSEEILAAIWAEVLGPEWVERVGAHDDFFTLGGHSLLATQVISRVREAFGVELPVRTLFEAPTVAALAARIGQAGRGAQAPPTVRVPREGRLPLSFAQQRLWFLDQLAPGSAAYNIPVAIELTGDLELAVLAAALAEVVRRHEALRTTFQVVDGEPVQVVAARAELGPPVIDLRSLPADTREEEANRLTAAEAQQPFDLGSPGGGSLLRVALLRLAGEQHVALLTMHHIVSDGWSMGVLIREISALYTACLEGRPSPLPELPVQYRDYALWQRSRLTGEMLEQEIAFWREALAGIPVLQLPTDRPRPPVQTFRGAVRRFEVPAATTAALKALGQRQGGTLFMVLLGAFAALLHRYTGQDDVAIGSPAANRTRPQWEGLIGFFVNTLVLRIDLSGAPSFAALFARVRRASVDAFSHQELPFEKVVFELQPERNLSISPLFQVMFSFQNAPRQNLSLPGLTLRPFVVETRTAKFDLTLDVGESAGGLTGSLEHNVDLFDRTTVDRMLGHFGRLLEVVTAEPGTSVADLPLLSAGERNQLLVEWNATDRPGPAGLVHEWSAAQAARTPEAVAVTFGEASLTYRELDRRANGLAWRLLELGVGPEVRVGIALERSLEMVVGVLAVLKAGGAYVPLDPSYPAERLAFMVEDSGLATVLRSPLHVAEAAAAPHTGVGADNAAYVIYTSGSTGRPKGVQISHGALANLLAAMGECLGIGARDVLLAVTSLSFDIAGLELYLPLMGGSRIVLASREEAADGQRLQELIAGATVLQATPATWRLLLDSRWQGGEGLKALCGGEALSPSLASSLLERVGALWNCYGPTETTIYSIVEEVVQVTGAVAIGRPVANTDAYVLDGRGAPVPLGAAGELALGGAGVARGYLGRPELTAERFVPNPFGAPGSRLYRTGDLVRYRADGALGFLGRLDHQVKIRGFRVELGEVEAVLASHPAVRTSTVVALADRREDLRLVAYVVVDAEARVSGTPAELRAFLKKALPDSMVPSSFVFLDALPLTPSGKVDRRALPAPDGASPGAGAELAAPATAVEEVLAEIWRKVLGVTRVGRHDNFFDLGGHSLLLAELRQRLQERFGRELSMVEMFRHATVAAMAEHLAAAGAAEPPPPPEIPDRSATLRQGRERLKQRGERQARRAGERPPGGTR